MYVYDKKNREITLIRISQDLLQTMETEKERKYDLLESELA